MNKLREALSTNRLYLLCFWLTTSALACGGVNPAAVDPLEASHTTDPPARAPSEATSRDGIESQQATTTAHVCSRCWARCQHGSGAWGGWHAIGSSPDCGQAAYDWCRDRVGDLQGTRSYCGANPPN